MKLDTLITQTSAKTLTKLSGDNHWGLRHVEAWNHPRGPEAPIVRVIQALADYADSHAGRYNTPISDDGVLGAEWLNMVKACRGLLNGELGRLDAGTLDGLLCNMASEAGFEPKDWE